MLTVRLSLWLLDIVVELDRGRDAEAALAVAEERLRFSRDVHDVLGRRLATIAVQAELAATLAGRGDDRAADRMLEVRSLAHDGLKEARELARGYRAVDLAQELDGAVSLLRSAGIDATVAVDGLPEDWHEPAAWVVREAVTNVLRHSRATCVEVSYADRVLAVRNDGALPAGGSGGPESGGGTGLAGVRARLAALGAGLEATRDGHLFTVRMVLP
nr:histidine kinase [Nocardioides sp. IC4_145]